MEQEKRKRIAKRKKGKKAKKILLIVAIVLLSLIVILFLTGVILYATGKNRLYGRAGSTVPTAMESDETEMLIAQEKAKLATVQWQDDWIAYAGKIYEYNTNSINLLFLGIDQQGLMQKETDYSNWDAGQADAIFVLSLNPTDKAIKIVAVPRNSMVNLNIYGEDGVVTEQIRNQICLQYGYAGGGSNGLLEMKRAVSDLLYGLPIHGVTAISYDAITTMNDMIGGVDVVVLEDITQHDPLMVKGETVHLMGEHAYLYLWYRDATSVGSPTARLQRQKQYLSAYIQQAKQSFRENSMIVMEMYDGLTDYMITDITLDEAVYLATEVLDYQFDMESIYLLEGTDDVTSYITDEGTEDFFDDYYLDEESIKRTVFEVFYREVEF